MPANRKIYESNLEAQLAQWKADIDVLKAEAARAEVGAKIRYDRTIAGLQHQHEQGSLRLANLKEATDDVWVSVKTHTEAAWSEIKSIFHRTTEKG